MPPRFRILSHVEPSAIRSIADSHPRLQHLTNVLVERHGLSRERARHFVERILTHVLDDFGETYSREMSARIDRIVQLRDRVTGIYESAINGHGLPEGVTPTSVEGMFRDLQHEMDSLQSPTRRAHEDAPLIRDDVASERLSTLSNEPAGIVSTPDVVGRRTTPEGLQTQREAFRQLDANTQRTISDASELAPDLVRRVIHTENSSSLASSLQELTDVMRRDGMTESDIARMIQGLENMSEAQRQAAHAAGITDARLRDATSIERLRDSRLRNAATGSNRLRRWAVEAPDALENMWEMYNRKSRSYPFDTYVGYLERHIRGNFGEFEAAFRLGNDFAVLKAPDGHVTVRGTDLVVVDRRTGDLLLIDNKSLNAEKLQAVSALTRNLPHNVLSDLQEFQTFSNHSDAPIEVTAAVQRFEQANQAIQAYTSGMSRSQLSSEPVQQHIAGILRAHDIRRVITNAGGRVSGLSPALQRIGIELMDLN